MFFDAERRPDGDEQDARPGPRHPRGEPNNLYAGVTMRDARDVRRNGTALNSRLVKRNGRLVEEVYRVGGRYDREIRRIVGHLADALPFAHAGDGRRAARADPLLRDGRGADRIAYDIAWVRDQESPVDTINGFVEVYMDPRGVKGAWEGIVCYVNPEKTRASRRWRPHAQWFEDHMPWDPRYPQAGGARRHGKRHRGRRSKPATQGR